MKEMTCSFCGRSSREVSMIPGADGNICVDCVRHANEMVERHAKQANAAPDLPPTPTPRAIKEIEKNNRNGVVFLSYLSVKAYLSTQNPVFVVFHRSDYRVLLCRQRKGSYFSLTTENFSANYGNIFL